jgi:hypothetical protein
MKNPLGKDPGRKIPPDIPSWDNSLLFKSKYSLSKKTQEIEKSRDLHAVLQYNYSKLSIYKYPSRTERELFLESAHFDAKISK